MLSRSRSRGTRQKTFSDRRRPKLGHQIAIKRAKSNASILVPFITTRQRVLIKAIQRKTAKSGGARPLDKKKKCITPCRVPTERRLDERNKKVQSITRFKPRVQKREGAIESRWKRNHLSALKLTFILNVLRLFRQQG